jgi:hypothetical protein
MTNPTSNFGWQMPTPTDLVTDLPADFEVFGQAVDTDFADLLGGTTGQILSKASATDLDFTWITNDVGDITAVTVTAPITGGGTSGSVGIAISGATTSASGAVQLSDSTSTTSSVLASTPTATKAAYDLAASAYASGFTNNYFAGKNKIMNGDFSIWQRGSSFANPAVFAYFADRFYSVSNNTGGTVTLSQQTFTGTTIPVAGARLYFRTVGTAPTGASFNTFGQKIENVQSFAGQTVTVSFYAKSDSARNVTPNLIQNFGSGGSTEVTTSGSAIALTTSWARYSQTFTVPSISGKTIGTSSYLSLEISQPVNVSHTIEYYGIQLEAGSVATPFQTASGFLSSELVLCQRYYWVFGYGNATTSLTTTSQMVNGIYPVKMRTTPSFAIFNSAGNFFEPGVGVRSFTISSLSVNATNNGYILETTTTSSGVTTVKQVAYYSDNFAASAEL